MAGSPQGRLCHEAATQGSKSTFHLPSSDPGPSGRAHPAHLLQVASTDTGPCPAGQSYHGRQAGVSGQESGTVTPQEAPHAGREDLPGQAQNHGTHTT